jgi:hypothetical protein
VQRVRGGVAGSADAERNVSGRGRILADSRGKRVSLCRACDLPEDAPTEMSVLVKAAASSRGHDVLTAPLLLVAAGAGLYAMVVGGIGVASVVIFVLLTLSVVKSIVFGGGIRRLAFDACLQAGHCAACGYPLLEIEPEADGCRVCPECGAAWRA